MKLRKSIRFTSIAISLFAVWVAAAAKQSDAEPALDAGVAFVKLPSDYIDLLSPTTRAEMVAHFQADSVLSPINKMMGRSELISLTPDFLKVKLTAVSTLQIRLLPAKNGTVVATVYTIDNGVGAPDSELRFYTAAMDEIPLRKIFKEPDFEVFFPTLKRNSEKMKEVTAVMPFPTVEYTLSAETTELKGQLTVGHYMTREDYKTIKPYIGPDPVYVWDGSRYKLASPQTGK